jgi:hypothetical protein
VGAQAPAQVTPIGGRRGPRAARWAALAAVLAGAVLVPLLRLGSAVSYDPASVAARLSPAAARLPAEWTERMPWGTVRGADGPSLTDEARSARLGARLVDLEVAVRSGDHAAAAQEARRVRALLGDVPGGGILSPTYASIEAKAGEPADSLRPLLKEGREGIAQLVEKDYLEAAAWAEGARLAAAAHDAAFFRGSKAPKALERSAALPGLSETGRATVERVRAALPGEKAPDWTALGQGLDDLLGALGR